jgi:integrase
MVHIEQRKPNGEVVKVRKVSPIQNLRAAEQFERQLRQSILDGTFGKEREVQRVPTLAEFESEFMTTYVRVNNKPSTVSTKQAALQVWLVPFFGKMHLDEIGPREIERFKSNMLDAGMSPKTTNNYLSMLRRILTLAAEWRIISHVPPVKWLKCPPSKFDFLDFGEADRLIAAADDEWRPMILTALKTGMRLGELLALLWEDVDLVAGRLMVRRAVARGIIGTPKSGRTREIPLSADLQRCLKAHRHLRGELVFCKASGEMYRKEETKHPLWRACKRAGLRRIGWHCLRHTFASHLVMRGAPIKAVQELMGHSTIEMTMRYSHLSPDVRRDAVSLLDYSNLTATDAKSTVTN